MHVCQVATMRRRWENFLGWSTQTLRESWTRKKKLFLRFPQLKMLCTATFLFCCCWQLWKRGKKSEGININGLLNRNKYNMYLPRSCTGVKSLPSSVSRNIFLVLPHIPSTILIIIRSKNLFKKNNTKSCSYTTYFVWRRKKHIPAFPTPSPGPLVREH